MLTLPFVKMQGLGNDFILIDDLSKKTSSPITPELARRLCDRRFGIGADQVLWLKPFTQSDAKMEILNADGTIAEMCGNGIRAVALYLYKHGPKPHQPIYHVETLAGISKVEVKGSQVSVDMGKPVLGGGFPKLGESISISGQEFKFFEVSMGNPHAVIFVEDLNPLPLEKWGPSLETHSRFPKRTNVEFVQVENAQSIRVKVWERGAGATLACGTGACASAVSALATGRAKSPVQVHLPGGKLQIFWSGPDASVIMEGPAQEVFHGEYVINDPYSKAD